jgi:hypothetical protein
MPSGASRLLLFLFLGSLLLAMPARADKPVPCGPGRYAVAGAPLVEGTGGTSVEVTADQVTIDGLCGATRVRTKRKKTATVVSGKWKSCTGLRGKVKLKGRIDEACETLTATLRAKKFKRPFTAARTGAALVDDATRLRVLGVLRTAIEALPRGDRAVRNQQILEILQTQPEFVATGITATNTVWGRFADGTVHTVLNDAVLSAPAQSPIVSAAVAPRPASSVPRPAPSGSAVVKILRAYGTISDEGDVFNEAALFAPDYAVTEGRATVDELKSMRDVSVLYLKTHAGETGQLSAGGSPVYVLWTDTPVTAATLLQYRGDMSDGSLQTAQAEHDVEIDPVTGKRTYTTPEHFAITPAFIRKYWKFTDDSLVVLQACHAGSDGVAVDLHRALREVNVSGLAGWTGPVAIDTTKNFLANALFLDRLLGANVIGSEQPPNRPLTFDNAETEMAAQGLHDIDITGEDLITDRTTFIFHRLGGDFTLLRPAIASLAWDEVAEQLT